LVLNKDHVAGLGTLLAFRDGEFNALTFIKVAETIHLDFGIVYEDVVAVFSFNKTVAFATIEPLDRTDDSFFHLSLLLLQNKKNYLIEVLDRFIGGSKQNDPTDQPRAVVFLLIPTKTSWHPTTIQHYTPGR
jgi:hypothetical protein